MLYYIHQTPFSSWRVEGGSGDEITPVQKQPPTLITRVVEVCVVIKNGTFATAHFGVSMKPLGHCMSLADHKGTQRGRLGS